MTEKISRLLWNVTLFLIRVVLAVMLAGGVFYVGVWHGSSHMEPVLERLGTPYVVCEYTHSTNGRAGTEGTRNCHSVDKMRVVHAVGLVIYRPINQ